MALGLVQLCCHSRTNTFWVQSSTERRHACSSHGDCSHCLPPNCQLGQSVSVLRNEQQTNNFCNFQAAYGNLSGQRMEAFCLKTLLQMEKLPISLLFSSERVAPCWLAPPARSVPMARMLCAHQGPAPPLPFTFSFPPHPSQSQGRSSVSKMRSTASTFPLQKKACFFWWQKPDVTPQDTKMLAALPAPCPTDGRETTRALVPSPCRGCFFRWDRAGGCRSRNSSPSPARGRGSAAWSAATQRSEPASRWPVGEGTEWIPPLQCNNPLHFSPRGFTKRGSHLVGNPNHA